MELRIERGPNLARGVRVDARPVVVLPLESSVVELRSTGSDPRRLDRTSIALLPAGTRHRVRPLSAVTKLLTLAIEPRDRDAAHREYRPHVDRARFAELLAHEAVLVRTRWFDELAHRYVFEIHDCEKHGSKAARFLETELTKELYFLAKEHVEQKTRASVLQEASDVVKRARAKIEAALFEPLSVEELARLCGTSASTLLRAFRREVGVAPATYARDRRLDEALLLLEAGKWTASEVATRVGYASLPAFTVAFRRRFGVVPSRARAAPSPTLPPQGEPLTKSRKPLTRSRK